MSLTDNDIMPFGKHKGVRLSEVPRSYAEWLCNQDGFKEKSPRLYEYFMGVDAEDVEGTDEEWDEVKRKQKEEELKLKLAEDRVENSILASAPEAFGTWWQQNYGRRLKEQRSPLLIAHLRVAREAWCAAMPVVETTKINVADIQAQAKEINSKTKLNQIVQPPAENVPF